MAAALALLAVLLPVRASAAWLDGLYTATPDKLMTGVRLLKLALLVLAGAAVATDIGVRMSRTPAGRDAVGPKDRVGAALLLVILLLATALRLHSLGTELWLDEIQSFVRYITLDVPQIIGTYDTQNQHPLYSLLAHAAWVGFGRQEWAIRLPAVAFGVASLWATYAFARRLTTRAESLLTVLLLAVSYHHVWFSQNARGYTAMQFFAIVGTLLLLRLAAGVSRPARLAWMYAVVMALATYAHATAALIVVGHLVALGIAFLVRRRDAAPVRIAWPLAAMALSGIVAFTLYAVVLPQFFTVVRTPTLAGLQIVWTSPAWMIREALAVLGKGVTGGLVVVAVGVGVLAVGVASYWRQSRLLVLATICPLLVTAATVIALRHNLWPRFFFFGASFFVLFAIRGGFVLVRAVLRRHAEAVATAGAIAVAGLSALTVPRAWQPKQQFLAVATWVDSQLQPGDAVVAPDIAGYVYLSYHTPPGWYFTSLVPSLEEIEGTSRRTWVVYSYPTELKAVLPDLASRLSTAPYHQVRVFPATVGDGEIFVVRRDSPRSDD